MSSLIKRILKKLWSYRYVLHYLWFHKVVFQITNTKFDITYCVFRESFIEDQYTIREYLASNVPHKSLLFLDVGRNHGLVFFYTMYWLMKTGIRIPKVDYIGIDPSPLKFVYFNFHKYLEESGIEINYRLIDRAVVFDSEATVNLKYGESNFGNFNVSGSNYSTDLRSVQPRFSYVEIEVDAISAEDILDLVANSADYSHVVVKIDCKNRTEILFQSFCEKLCESERPVLVACEGDGSGSSELGRYRQPDSNTLVRIVGGG